MSSVVRCPECGKIIPAIFPMHTCTKKTMDKVWPKKKY
jgi:hypothetical protein